jgi:hypothetical protein
MLHEDRESFQAFMPPSQAPDEIRTLVLKLRWMGMEEEAEELADYLAVIAPQSILLDVQSTD